MRFIWTHLLVFKTLMFSEWNLNEMLEVTVWEEIEQNMNLFDQGAISHLFWNVTSKYSRQKKWPVEFPQKSPKPFKFHKKTVYFRWSPRKENMFHFGKNNSLKNLPEEKIQVAANRTIYICWTARSMERSIFFFLKSHISAPGAQNSPIFFS